MSSLKLTVGATVFCVASIFLLLSLKASALANNYHHEKDEDETSALVNDVDEENYNSRARGKIRRAGINL